VELGGAKSRKAGVKGESWSVDKEGMKTMRVLAENLTWLLKKIQD